MSQEKELKRIADAFEKVIDFYENPQAWMERISQGLSQVVGGIMPQIAAPPVEGAPVAVSRVEVTIAPEEKEAILKQAMADIEEQMTEFKGFIGQALSELPEGQLKRMGELIKKGEKFKLRRRHGCIYLDFGHGDDDFYLRM